MAKLEHAFTGDFDRALEVLDAHIIGGSVSATFEDGSTVTAGGVRVAVRVYERYSYTGSNRVSLNLTLVGDGENLYLSGITSGGSQAMFFKINRVGEDAFLGKLWDALAQL
ncbi:DUF6054 family protein [Tsukamurella tyrosinosolvens]|uniref:DUF6054 family protein n=1 Tax=Tsukamurella tyrosinosolvens TaxID=57704 RepID=UPI000DF6AE84|nr:DUF6054 family protein [Tsukamurella tyrosinosolvens]RDB48461.1 hypothetical protein DVB87_08020 [Tsukamurella tyrosinosolvens]